jgi:thioredoxin-related protein
MHFTKKLLFPFIFFVCFTIYGQESAEKEVLNIFTFEEVEKLHPLNPKPLLVFVYTDWCKICHGMKRTTFRDKKIQQLLNKKFYFIMLNGEEKKDITFFGKTFIYKPTGTNTGMHELASKLATKEKRIAYPTTIILNTAFEIDAQLIGFYNTQKMTQIITQYLK